VTQAGVTEDDPEMLITALPQSSSNWHVGITFAGERLERPRAAPPTTLPLHDMPPMASIDKLLGWSKDFDTIWTRLHHIEVTSAGQARTRDRTSRHFSAADLQKINEITEQPTRPSQREYLRARKIAKSNGTARLIIDGRPANDRIVGAPRPSMPDLPTMFRHAEARWGWTADLKAWFFQIPLPQKLRPLFTMRLAVCRGKFIVRQLVRLPMGASFAPAVAQLAAEAVLKEVTARLNNADTQMFVWIDNICVTGPSEEVVNRAKELFKQVCAEACVTVKEISETTTEIELLGLTWNLAEKSLGPNGTLRERLVTTDVTKASTCREFMAAVGLLFFPNYMYGRLPLAACPDLFAELQRACTEARNGGWNANFHTTAAGEFDHMRNDLLRQREIGKPRSTPDTIIWSDASTTHLAWLRQEGMQDTAASVASVPGTHEEMYYRELRAAIAGSLATGSAHMIACDNRAAVSALRKGHSSTRRGNRLLRHWCARTTCTHVAWVETAQERADELSRGARTTRPPWRPSGDELRWCWDNTALRLEKGGDSPPDTSSSSKSQLYSVNTDVPEAEDITHWIPVSVENDEVMMVTQFECLPEPYQLTERV
jgi:hypothetical protein